MGCHPLGCARPIAIQRVSSIDTDVKSICTRCMNKTLALVIASLATTLAVGAPVAQAQPLHEDNPGWSCTTQGNRVCGPGNSQGAQPGQYVNGKLVPWAHAEVPAWCKDICLGA